MLRAICAKLSEVSSLLLSFSSDFSLLAAVMSMWMYLMSFCLQFVRVYRVTLFIHVHVCHVLCDSSSCCLVFVADRFHLLFAVIQ